MRSLNIAKADTIMQLATGLHNFRVANRQQRYAVSRERTRARLHPFEW